MWNCTNYVGAFSPSSSSSCVCVHLRFPPPSSLVLYGTLSPLLAGRTKTVLPPSSSSSSLSVSLSSLLEFCAPVLLLPHRQWPEIQTEELSSREQAAPPNHQWWYAKWKLSRNIYTLHTRFGTFGADLYAQSVPINKISASERSRKLIKSALLVG